MESQLTRRRMLGGAATIAGSAALLAAPGAVADRRRGCATPTPEGFRKMLVYIAEGPASAGSITDPDAVLAFQRKVMGRDRAAVMAYVEEAKRFFLRRFGLDFTGVSAPTPIGPWEIDGATLAGSVFDPDHGYTAYVVSEESIDEEGWTVRDASFGVSITADQVLHGSWGGAAGKLVRAGSFVVFGDYNIKADRPGRGRDGTIMIHFESGSADHRRRRRHHAPHLRPHPPRMGTRPRSRHRRRRRRHSQRADLPAVVAVTPRGSSTSLRRQRGVARQRAADPALKLVLLGDRLGRDEEPAPHRAARHVERTRPVLGLEQLRGVVRSHAHDQLVAVDAAAHVACDQKADAAEHPPLVHVGPRIEPGADAVGESLVEGHGASLIPPVSRTSGRFSGATRRS